MGITKDEVTAIASLARLHIPEDQTERMARQMDTILSHMDTLNELDTSAVEPMYSPVEQVSVLRDDKAVASSSREAILSNAPDEDGQYFVVPKIV